MKIAFLGDLVIDAKVRVDPEVVRFLRQAQCVIVNLEGVILPKGHGVSAFKTYGSVVHNDHDAAMRLMNEVGVTHANVYNNHMIDYGPGELDRTLAILRNAGIQVLAAENELPVEDGSIGLSNSGLAETFGIYPASESYGHNINDMLLERKPVERWAGRIIHTHYGIEQVRGLCDYELKWFEWVSQFTPRIIIRHHPHCIQQPFCLNGVPCFPSIGDFAFNFRRKRASKGLVVMFDTAKSAVESRIVECEQYHLRLAPNSPDMILDRVPAVLGDDEKALLRERYRAEYREAGGQSLKKALKYFLGRERPEHVLSMSSKHFIQPYVMGELL